MSEWASVLAVFWVLWALDGVRLGPRRVFSVVGWRRYSPGARIGYSRCSLPGALPLSWRVLATDVPLVLSPAGVANAVAGAVGRPAETPLRVMALRWDEVREVALAGGWIYVNGERFCPDTGHVTPRQLLALAQSPAVARERQIRRIIRSWFRVASLRRRVAVLVGRSQLAATVNSAALALLVALSIYVFGGVPARLPERWTTAAGIGALAAAGVLLLLHITAVVAAWRTLGRLRSVRPEKRGATLISAALLPPQALRLRTLLADGFFPAQHPLALTLAFGDTAALRSHAFNVAADLHWPIPAEQPPVSTAVAAWYRGVLGAEIAMRLAPVGLTVDALLAPPAADAAASCTYCPRCRDQFIAGPAVCPHGIPLQPLPGRQQGSPALATHCD